MLTLAEKFPFFDLKCLTRRRQLAPYRFYKVKLCLGLILPRILPHARLQIPNRTEYSEARKVLQDNQGRPRDLHTLDIHSYSKYKGKILESQPPPDGECPGIVQLTAANFRV